MAAAQLTLSELNNQIKEQLDDAFPSLLWIKAEISELNQNRTGHCYLELVDVDEATKNVVARCRATIWSYTFRMLKPFFETTTGQAFSEGLKVLVSAKVEFHPMYGLSLNIRDIDPTYTMGDMARKRREILLQLEEDGVVDMNKELELPLVPQRIAIVSSPTAAGLQDFRDQLANNAYNIHFYTKLFPAIMQGKDAAASIIIALEQVFQYEDFFDLVVIIRGGGAQIDLASFDHYELAYHITQLPIPVLTGIGHDKDETAVDLVAHTKLKTPTAVAEFLISGAAAFEQMLDEMKERFVEQVEDRLHNEKEFLKSSMQKLTQGVRELVSEENNRFNLTNFRLEKSIPVFLATKLQQLQEHKHQIEKLGTGHINEQNHQLSRKLDNLQFFMQRQFRIRRNQLTQSQELFKIRLKNTLREEKNKLTNFEGKVRLMDPKSVLKRGYSLTYSDGHLIKSTKQLSDGDVIETQLADGKVKSKITKK
ncbi:exodeoxyribonuclease VII large subunit [uncultured Sunxiuqinia sp.]|uniref:exodeoxyribonuclease VII large subunit n=1 Tax=uncultured Sunxiuqinia sp. TaxID=1573825 RepID=UPI002AA608E9|nr:exodeoxyribonuclease VII large subunit [uncultured Sunxiuqinia sp.]